MFVNYDTKYIYGMILASTKNEGNKNIPDKFKKYAIFTTLIIHQYDDTEELFGDVSLFNKYEQYIKDVAFCDAIKKEGCKGYMRILTEPAENIPKYIEDMEKKHNEIIKIDKKYPNIIYHPIK